MTKRSLASQGEHDAVVRELSARWKSSKYSLVANPDGEKNVGVNPGGHFPDLIAFSGREVHWIAEVETADSLNDMEAGQQWRAYGELGCPLFLVVPLNSVAHAQRLVIVNRVKVAGFYEYSIENGQIIVRKSAA